MNELSPEAKILLRFARDAFSPKASRLKATYAALEARASVPMREAPTPSGNLAFDPTQWGLWRLIGVGVLVTLGTGSAVLGARFLSETKVQSSEPAVADSVTRNSESRSNFFREPNDPSVSSPSIHRSSEPQDDEATSAPVKGDSIVGISKGGKGRRDSRLYRKSSKRSKRLFVSDDIDDSLSQEIALLRSARAALDRRDAARALALLDQHRALYPLGTLQQEQLVTRVLALCVLGRDSEARAAARELKRAAPRSPHLARIRASCAGESDSKAIE